MSPFQNDKKHPHTIFIDINILLFKIASSVFHSIGETYCINLKLNSLKKIKNKIKLKTKQDKKKSVINAKVTIIS